MSTKYFKINVYSHHFVLSQVQSIGQGIVESFAKQYVQLGLVKQGRKFIRAPIKVFAARVCNSMGRVHEYRFHINQFNDFMKHLSNMQVLPHVYEMVKNEVHSGLDVHLNVLAKWILRDYQVPVVDYLISEKPCYIKLLETQTGSGKSLMSVYGLSKLSKRFVIIIKPMYIDKWKSDLKEILGLTKDEVTVVQGAPDLMSLITSAKDGTLESKAIIISNRTLQSWLKTYEKTGDCTHLGYDCNPAELFQILDAGVRLIDEVHQDFHLNFKIDLYTNVSHSISLSATLKADDPFLNRMYEMTYPREIRYAGLAYNKYAYAYSWVYQVKDPLKIRTTEWGSTVYSHHAFERSVMNNRDVIRDYLNMIVKSIEQFFLQKYVKGDRLLIYCASIQLCTIVTERLCKEYPNLVTKRYVEDDSYENLMEADVSVSTLLSAGTGVDIPGLTTVILTTAISSSQSNIQGFGRLRKLPDKKLQFVYFVCSDIPKHLEYHYKKRDMLQSMTLGYSSVNYPIVLGS